MSLNSMDRIKMLLKARTQCIWVRTFEEKRFIDELSSLIRTDFSTFTLMVHSLTQGLATIPVTQKPKDVITFDEKKALIQKIFLEINNAQNNPDKNAPNFMFVLRDFDDAFVQAVTIRTIRDLKPGVVTNTYTPIFIVSPTADIPLKLSKMFQIVDYDVPSKQYVSAMVNAAIKTAIKNENDLIAKLKEENKSIDGVEKFVVPTDKQKENIIKSLIGLTANEIMGILMRSKAEYNALDEKVIMEEKINAIKATGILDYRVPKVYMKDIGGNDEFKNWFEDVRMCFSPDAKRLNIPMQKGYLAIGHPGTC